jgi:cobalt/nickel transport system permease protein
MSHIHIPDGVLPTWLWVSGYAITALLIAIFWRRGKATSDPRRFALLGVFSAIMILAMSIEIPPFGAHINLSVATGIVLGPELSILAALVVNVILSLVGHGGVTVAGLNTLVISTEMIVGYYAFHALMRLKVAVGKSGFVATVIGLACGTTLSFLIILIAHNWIVPAQMAGKIPSDDLLGMKLSLGRLAAIMFGLGAIGWIVEGLLTSGIVTSLVRLYPGLIAKDEDDGPDAGY